MILTVKNMGLLAALCLAPAALNAQVEFKVGDRTVQVHSFASQGFIYSNDNNYMSMPTSKGSFAMTDGGANISSQITDKFRVGAQVYLRNVGEFGNWKPELDWAFGSYKFKSWFGVKGGKVKTTLGLFNDIQDMDSLHTFALLPESIYPIDWRSTTIAHTGGDVFGDIAVKHLGTFSYTGYAGMRPDDSTSGYRYASKATVNYASLTGPQVGGDLRWTTPVGALFGVSYLTEDITGKGTSHLGGVINTAFKQTTTTDQVAQYYGQYTFKNLQLDVEYRRNLRDMNIFFAAKPTKSIVDARAWYVAGTYRVNKYLDLGAYRSIYLVDDRKNTAPASAHEYDTTISARINLVHQWYVKLEGHFIDGAPTSPSAARGFYTADNPGGLKPTTNMFVVRTGVSF